MRGSRLRAGDLVRPGPGGSPPPGLRAYEPVDSSPVGLLVRPAGSVAYLRSTWAAWLNCNGTALGWVSCGTIRSLALASYDLLAMQADWASGKRMSIVTRGGFGADAQAFDLTGLACDTKGPFRIFMKIIVKSSTAAYLYARVNGASDTNLTWATTAGTGTSRGALGGVYGPGAVVTGDSLFLEIDCLSPQTSVSNRIVRFRSCHWRSGATGYVTSCYGMLADVAGEIVSVGVEDSVVGATLDGALSSWSLERVAT